MAFVNGTVHEIPGKTPKKIKPVKHTVLAMLRNTKGDVLLEKRPASGIWGGLYSFPEFKDLDSADDWCMQVTGCPVETRREWAVVKHSFSHYDLFMQPLELFISGTFLQIMDAERWLWYNIAAPAEVGLAAPVKKLLQSFGEQA